MSDKISSFNVKRFDKLADPAAHDPETALLAALDWVRSTDEKPDHIIVFTGRTMKDGGSGTRFFQAGNYTHHAQQGLCIEGSRMIREN